MVKRLGKLIGITLFFFLALILFMPKSSFYFLAEKEMHKRYALVVSNEELDEKFFSLDIKDLDVSLKGVQSANIEYVNIMFLVLYNSINLQNIELSSVAKSFIPTKLKSIHISYTLLSPLVIKGKAEGEFGVADMEFHLLDKALYVRLRPSEVMLRKYARSLRFFKRNKEGEYIYAKAL